jgi:hypothetical protein
MVAFMIHLPVLISACSSGVAPTQGIPGTVTQSNSPVQTKMPTPAETQNLAATESPAVTEMPPPTAVKTVDPALPSGNPRVVSPGPVIAPGNAGQVVELAGWGKGFDYDLATISNSQLASNGEVLVATEFLGDMPDINRRLILQHEPFECLPTISQAKLRIWVIRRSSRSSRI